MFELGVRSNGADQKKVGAVESTLLVGTFRTTHFLQSRNPHQVARGCQLPSALPSTARKQSGPKAEGPKLFRGSDEAEEPHNMLQQSTKIGFGTSCRCDSARCQTSYRHERPSRFHNPHHQFHICGSGQSGTLIWSRPVAGQQPLVARTLSFLMRYACGLMLPCTLILHPTGV